MLKLIQAEFYKLFKNKTFKVLCIIAVILSSLMLILSTTFTEDMFKKSLGNIPEEEKQIIIEEKRLQSSTENQLVNIGNLGVNTYGWKDEFNPTSVEVFHSSFGSGLIEILIGILVGSLLAKEYSKGTIKNILAYGKKREHFYIAKFVASLLGVSILLAFLVGVSTIGYTLTRGLGQGFQIADLFDMAKTFLAAVIVSSSVVALLMLITTLVKSNGAIISISVCIFILLPTLIGSLYGQFDWFDKLYELTPFYNSAVATSLFATSSDIVKSMCASIVTLIISLILGITIFKKQDIK